MNTDTTSIILKTDSRGRVRTPLQRREELVAEFERSGLPATRFAALVGVRYQTFATWVQKRRKRDGGAVAAESAASGSRPVRFAEVRLEGASAPVAAPLRVLLPGGAVVEVSAGAQVPLAAQLIKTLCGGVPC
jgi:transposase-like protein